MLNNREQEILDIIKEYIEQNGFSPTTREICSKINFNSTSSVHRYLESLENKGYISRIKNRSRTLRVITPLK